MLAIGKPEIEAVERVINSGKLFRYHQGGECQTFEREWAEFVGGKYVQLTASGSTALATALASLGIGPGDEVIVPAHTYMATATAVVATGAIPVIVDIDESITLDPEAVDRAVGPRTRAMIPVHMWGQICDMRRLKAVAKKHNLLLIEDCCQAIGGSYKGRMVGTFADAGCFSFNFFKNMTCGEGGAVVSRTRSAHEKVVIHTDCCGYFWEGPSTTEGFCSSSARVSEIEGAILREQLKRIPGLITKLRKHKARIIAETADTGLTLSKRHDPEGECATTLYYQLPSAEQTAEFAKLVGCGITGRTGRHTYNEWKPILAKRGHIHPALDPFRMEANKDCRMDYHPAMCPVSLDILLRTAMMHMNHAWKAADIKAQVKKIRAAAKSVL